LNLCKAHFTLGVRANVQSKSSIPIGAKVEISPKGLARPQIHPDELCPTLVSLVFLHTYFCVAQSCKRRVYFYIYRIHKLKKCKKLKTLLQNHAVLSRAAHSGPKQVPDRAR